MNAIEQVVLESYKKILLEEGISDIPEVLDIPVKRETGLDSLGLVNLMVEIEEALDITLEPVLADIRQSSSLQEIAILVARAVEVSRV
jgi:acyl carrier protein